MAGSVDDGTPPWGWSHPMGGRLEEDGVGPER
jgi:hypothetical protein